MPSRSVKSGLVQLVAGAVVEPHPCAVLAGDKRSRRRASVPAWPPLYVLVSAAPGSAPRDPTTYLLRDGPLTSGLKNCTQTFARVPAPIRKSRYLSFLSWPSCLAAPRSALLVSVPLTPSTQPVTHAPGHLTPRPGGNPCVVSGRVRRALRPIRWGGEWSPVPGHAGHQRL